MTQPERNQRVLIALTLSSHGADFRAAQYANAVAKIIGGNNGETDPFKAALERADGFAADHLTRLVQAVAASAAFGVDEANLAVLLNYLGIEEARHFQLDKTFLDLFTMNELESLAEEIGLRKAMGERFKQVRAGKKDAFIVALLSVKGFAYRGTVPRVMRYPRKAFQFAGKIQDTSIAAGARGSKQTEATNEPEEALAAA